MLVLAETGQTLVRTYLQSETALTMDGLNKLAFIAGMLENLK